jgi:formylglycine-generating enzyme required for sulfatase activity
VKQYGTEHASGASTAVLEEGSQEDPRAASASKPSVQTSVLPGTAGSKSEPQTSIMQMGRITSPVEEGDAPVQEQTSSGSLEQRPPSVEDKTATVRVTADQALKGATVAETTAGFSSQPVNGPASENANTTIFASPGEASGPAQVSPEDAQTREVVRPSFSEQETRIHEILPVSTPPTSEGQRVNVPARRGGVTREISSADSSGLEFSQTQSQPLPRKRTGVFIASTIVVVLVIAAAVLIGYRLLFSRGRAARPPAPQVKVEQPTAAPTQPVAPPIPTAPAAPEGMVAVAAGSHIIGRNGADPLEQPQHKVDLPAFFIDRTEVTNAAYKKFVDATGRKPPTNWNGTNFPGGRDEYPVTGVSWQDAADYAAWSGKRLPSEDEWEAAARGTDERVYPWGNEWRPGLANIGSKIEEPADQYPSGLKEVGRYPQGASPAGAVDMIGNAWEWVADEIVVYPGNNETKLSLKPGVTYRVIRGGAYDGNKTHDATYRGYLDANQAYPKVGFRCAKDAK